MSDAIAALSQVKPNDLQITRQIIPWSNRNRPGWKLNPGLQWWFTQHTTGNRATTAGAQMHATFVSQGGGPEGVSFHLTVDDVQAIQLLPFDEAGFHAADGMDDYWHDVGGWGSIAMELCVNTFADPARWLKAKQNACAAWASILLGDPRWDYGTGGPDRFSADRYAPHRRWSDELKWCPTELLNEGNIDPWTGDGPMKEAIRALSGATGGAGVPDNEFYPEGMDVGIARALFGRPIGDDGKPYGFNPDGVISKKWITRGKETGAWPELVRVRKFDTRMYFQFSDGWTLWRTGNGPIREVK